MQISAAVKNLWYIIQSHVSGYMKLTEINNKCHFWVVFIL